MPDLDDMTWDEKRAYYMGVSTTFRELLDLLELTGSDLIKAGEWWDSKDAEIREFVR